LIPPELQDVDAARQAHARMPDGNIYLMGKLKRLASADELSEIEESVIKRHAAEKRKQMRKVKK